MKKFTLLILVLFSFSGIAMGQESEVVEKCICESNEASSLEKSTEAADVVFLGQVAEIRQGFSLHPGFTYVRFLPFVKYKGEDSFLNPESIVIFTPDMSDPCHAVFSEGNDYLVFAKGNPAFLSTTACDRTGIQENRKNDIKKLTEDHEKKTKGF